MATYIPNPNTTSRRSARAPRLTATAVVLAVLVLQPAAAASPAGSGHVYRPADALALAQMSPLRPAVEAARDRYRHPLKTLRFFGVKPNDTVVEIWPAPGYYAALLGPYLKAHGRYVAAGFVTDSPGRDRAMRAFAARFADRDRYGHIHLAQIGPPDHWHPVAAGTADLVLTFRNVHNWIAGGYQQPMFDAFYRALKPGGVLGLVEHRGWAGESVDEMKSSGYVPVAYVERLAAKAGFRLVGSSEINANPRDDHHHPRGVWTLPPTLALGELDRARYQAIGESDRMTLKFVKPR